MSSATLNRDFKKMAAEELSGEKVRGITIEESVDHTGDAILDITVVLESNDKVKVSGKSLLQLLRRASDYLLARNDQRFPHFHFKTTDDISAHA
jgi:hypothetical protein